MSSTAQTVPLSVALVAGALVALNPCSVPLLPAFLSYYLGAGHERLPRVRSGLLQGLLVGALLTLGVVGVFTAIGLPLVYGASRITDAVPWLGLAAGGAAMLAGVVALAGRGSIALPLPARLSQQHGRWVRPLVFGIAYGLASLGCSLPVFLAFLASSLSVRGSDNALAVLAAYLTGIAITILALLVVATFLREGLARRLGPLAGRLHRVSGLLLLLAGGYLSYFWAARVRLQRHAGRRSDRRRRHPLQRPHADPGRPTRRQLRARARAARPARARRRRVAQHAARGACHHPTESKLRCDARSPSSHSHSRSPSAAAAAAPSRPRPARRARRSALPLGSSTSNTLGERRLCSRSSTPTKACRGWCC